MISETAEPKNNRRGSVRPFRTAAALLILSAVLVSSFAVLSDSNESRAAVVIDGLQYELDDESSTAALVGYTNITGALSIPSAVTFEETEYTVTSIGEKAFNDCDTIT